MSEYPLSTIPPAHNGFTVSPQWKTLVTQNDALVEQRKQKSVYAKYNVTLKYDYLSENDFKVLWNFYMAMKGSFYSFYIYDVFLETHNRLFVGMGDGVLDTFDIPGKTTSAQSIYENGVLVYDCGVTVSPQNVNCTILTGGGDESSDRVQFSVPPASGYPVTCTFIGYLRMYVRFKEDNLSREHFEYKAFKTGIELQGLIPGAV